MKVVEVSPTDPRVATLIEEHRCYCAVHTPSGSGHALDTAAAEAGDVRYLIALEAEDLLGCIGYRPLTVNEAELKTLHVRARARGRGTGEALVRRLIDVARGAGFRQLFLETGRSEGFAASRRLYARLGFERCAAFGVYASDPFSYCMTRSL